MDVGKNFPIARFAIIFAGRIPLLMNAHGRVMRVFFSFCDFKTGEFNGNEINMQYPGIFFWVVANLSSKTSKVSETFEV